MKCVTLSLIKVRGHPNLVIIFSQMNFDMISLVQASIGSNSTHLVTYLTVVIIYLALVHRPSIGNGLTRQWPIFQM